MQKIPNAFRIEGSEHRSKPQLQRISHLIVRRKLSSSQSLPSRGGRRWESRTDWGLDGKEGVPEYISKLMSWRFSIALAAEWSRALSCNEMMPFDQWASKIVCRLTINYSCYNQLIEIANFSNQLLQLIIIVSSMIGPSVSIPARLRGNGAEIENWLGCAEIHNDAHTL